MHVHAAPASPKIGLGMKVAYTPFDWGDLLHDHRYVITLSAILSASA
jgi:hypothetical protein